MKLRKLSEHLTLYLIESLKSLYELYAENKSFKFLLINNKQLTKQVMVAEASLIREAWCIKNCV